MNEPNLQPSPAASMTGEAPPSVAVMPTLTPEQILSAKLEEMTMERDSLLQVANSRKEEIEKQITMRIELMTKLESLEKNPFIFVLSNHDAGSVLAEVGEELTKLTSAIVKLGEKGTLTFKLSIKPQNNLLIFDADIKSTPPKPAKAKAVFYGEEDGSLSRQNPNQREFSGFPGTREDRALAQERANPETR